MNSIIGLSPNVLRRAADLKERIEALQTQFNELVGGEVPAPAPAAKIRKVRRKKRRKMSPEGLANIRAGVAKRVGRKVAKTAALTPKAQAKAAPGKGKGELTVKAAILGALESGQAMGKQDIARKVSALRGKKTNPTSLNPTLNEMKRKDKTIVNPERGIYKLR